MKPETDIKIFIPHTGDPASRTVEPAPESEQEVLAIWQPSAPSGTAQPYEMR